MKKKLCITVVIHALLIFFVTDRITASSPSKNYVRLMELIRIEERESPLLAFNGFGTPPDLNLHKTSIEYFNRHPEIVRKIKSDLDDRPVRWRLENISRRLLYVPETRKEYAALFENYCKDVINAVLQVTGLGNPYAKIDTLETDMTVNPEINGIHAFIVHNLAEEYIATYVFSNDAHKEIAIKLTGKILLNEVGSFSSYIYQNNDGSFDLTSDSHTIWQNNAKNPYTALMSPVEETLHIALRQYTEKAIKDRIRQDTIKTVQEAALIVEDWISVEEAIVGGLVHALLPHIIEKHIYNLPESLIQSDIEMKGRYKKYRHLKKGIKIVEQLGHRESIKMYQDNPAAFRNLLL